jgi:hypothetical protein
MPQLQKKSASGGSARGADYVGDDAALQTLQYIVKSLVETPKKMAQGALDIGVAGPLRALGLFADTPPGELILGKNHEMGLVDWAVPGSGRGIRNLPLLAAMMGGRGKGGFPKPGPPKNWDPPSHHGRAAGEAAAPRPTKVEEPAPSGWWGEMTEEMPRGKKLQRELTDAYGVPLFERPEPSRIVRSDAKRLAARNQAMVPVEPRRLVVDPEEALAEGTRRAMRATPGALGERQRLNAVYDWIIAQKETVKEAGTMRAGLAHEEDIRRYLRTGIFGQYWYEGAEDALREGVERLRRAARVHQGLTLPPTGEAVAHLGRNIAATSPLTEPGENVDRALQAYFFWVAGGKRTDQQFPGFESHAKNLGKIVAGEPIHGPKVSNYLLDIFGSQRSPTIDRWMVEVLIPGRKSTASQVADWEYQVVSDRLTQLADLWGTTPVRAQAALWTGYKLLHDDRMIEMVKTHKLLPEDVVPSLATHIRAGVDRSVIAMEKRGTSWIMKGNPALLATLPIIGLASSLIEDDNAYTASQAQPAPVAEGPPSGNGMQGPAATRPRME